MAEIYRIVTILRSSEPLALKHPSEYCLEDGFLYQGAQWHAGELKVHSPLLSPGKLLAFQGKTVVLAGILQKDMNAILVKKGPCPSDYGEEESRTQMRSDWVGEETGFQIGRSTREKLASLSYLELREIEKFDGIAVNFLERGRQWEVSLANTLGINLNDVEIVAHYEIYRGKPMPRFKSQTRKTLAPREVMKEFFPQIYVNKGGEKAIPAAKSRLESFYIRARGENLKIMLEIFPRQ